MECKKIKLCEATQDKVYSDEYGFLGAKISYEITAKINIDKRVTQQVYRKVYKKTEGNQYVEIINEDLKKIFDLELFVASKNYWYGNISYIKINRVIKIELMWGRQTAIAEASDKNALKNALDGILNTEVYETDNYKQEALRWFEIKEGLPVIYQGETWKVEKLFHTPNPENKLCKIVSWKNDRSAYISCDFRLIDENGKIDPSGDHKFYKLPYYEYPVTEYELNLFNEEIRENDLSPYLVYGNDGGALFWQPLEEASRYIVYVYKYRSKDSIKKKLYLLEKKIIERNKCWCKVDNIYGVKYILRLEAENRAGDIIGRSRGIAIKFGNVSETEILPGYWNPQTIK